MKSLLTFALSISLSTLNAQISDFKDVDFVKVENIVKLNQGKNLDNLPILVYNLTSKLSNDVEKFRAIYLWVCENIIGDAYQHRAVNKKRAEFKNDSLGYITWNNGFKKIAAKKLLKHKKTMCTGYAYLIKQMCFIANIDCKIIDGYARSFETNVETLENLNHSWNAVKLNDKWYLCDATWSSGYMINGKIFIKDYNDGYFLTDPVLFAKNHYPINKKWFLNDSLTSNKFKPEPIVYGETFKHKVLPISPKNLKTFVEKNQEIKFVLKSLKPIFSEDISLVDFSGKEHKLCKIHDLKNENGIITFKYKFKSRGTRDLHLKIKKDIVASYTFKITKPKPLEKF
ncbi:transglutaminase domain-containing protein [Winogradskyella sp.]|uniref:transglutaminase domain-containing protein n=1 Tax=Winogradskyella sp. TaxID=1883156 RepID=UPI0026387B16|nr:transglutaminase domain-containing protein [Winogradskyella sp.]